MTNPSQEPTPSKAPCPCSTEPPKKSRRDFLLLIGFGLNAVAGAMISIPILGYLLSSIIKKAETEWISLGPLSKFPENTTRLGQYQNPHPRPWDGETAEIPCWVRNAGGGKFQIFAINCTHLGCPVRWFEESKLFMCPCHGGVFYENGDHAAGPPPRGLYEYQSKVENGNLMVKAGVMPTLANPDPSV